MESSVRTARITVYELLNLNRQVPDINPLQYDIRQLLKAAQSLNDYQPFTEEWILRKFLKGTYFEHILVDNAADSKEHKSFISEQVDRFLDWIKELKK